MIKFVPPIFNCFIAGVILLTASSCNSLKSNDPLNEEERQWLTEYDGKIIMFAEKNYPPLEFIDHNGVYQGISVDYVRLMEKRLNFKFKLSSDYSFHELEGKLKSREIHVKNNFTKTPDRALYLNFTENYLHIPDVIIVRNEIKRDLALDSLVGLKVAAAETYTIAKFMRNLYPGILLVTVPNSAKALKMVSFGEVDATITGLAFASYYIETEGIANLRVAGFVGEGTAMGFASRNDWPILHRILEKGLAQITEKERKAIYHKWISLGHQHFYSRPGFIYTLAVALGLILLFCGVVIAINRALKHQIALKTEDLRAEIAERVVTEEKLRNLQNLLKNIIDSMPSLIIAMNSEGRVIQWNRQAEIRSGVSKSKVLGREATEVLHFLLGDSICVLDGVSLLKSCKEDYIKRWVNGVAHCFDIRICPLIGMGGNGAVICIDDVTERMKIEEERLKLSTAMDYLAESVIITDRKGMIEYINPAFQKISGFSAEDVVGKNFNIFKSDKHDELFYRSMWEQISAGMVWTGHINNKMKDERYVEFQTSISPVMDSAENIVNFVSINRDVTQEVALENRLLQAQKMEAIGALAGGISHDFNNILSGIIGYSEIALQDIPSDSEIRHYLLNILNAANRARELVNQILAFSRRSEKSVCGVQIKTLIKEVLKLLRATLPATIEIRQHLHSHKMIMADPIQIHQILMNLCANAAFAMKQQGGELTISLADIELDANFAAAYSDAAPGPYIKLTVADTGCGIPPMHLPRIFDPFFTTKSKHEGTGLGLSVVHGIVKGCGGFITVASEINNGSAFDLYFPYAPVTHGPETSIGALHVGGESILFVDDESFQVDIAQQMLERLGYKVTTALNGEDALNLFTKIPGHFDLIISDMTMPKMPGDILARKILSIRPDIPIIICTGYSERLEDLNLLALGVKALVMKPILMKELSRTIRKVLD